MNTFSPRFEGMERRKPAKKILVVGCKLLDVATLSHTLMQSGYRVYSVENEGRLKIVAKMWRPDLVIYNTGATQGEDLPAATADQKVRGSTIPILFLTDSAVGGSEPVLLGPRRYLQKPFSREQLVLAVHDNVFRDSVGAP